MSILLIVFLYLLMVVTSKKQVYVYILKKTNIFSEKDMVYSKKILTLHPRIRDR